MNEPNRPQPRAGILRIKPHMLVADALPVDQSPTNHPPINIASNESAYGPSPHALGAAQGAINSIQRYAETAQQQLANAIARQFNLNPEGVVCGHGSDDLLARIARTYLSPGDELIFSCNGYQKIPNYAYANDAEAIAASDNDFTVDVDAILACVSDRTRIVMIANPDNPTGTYIPSSEIRRLHAHLAPHILLVLDSAYLEYVDADDYETPQHLIENHHNVLMTRTFSKVYGLAGARLGWLYAPVETADVLRRIGITFPVSSPALAAGVAALQDRAHTQWVLEQNRRVRQQFAQVLTQLGARVYPSQTNFLLVQFTDKASTASEVYDYLEVNGVVARRFAAQAFSDCVRFTIGLEAEMHRAGDLLTAFFNLREH